MKKYYKKELTGTYYYKLLTAIFILLSLVAVSFQSAVAKSDENVEQIQKAHVPGQLVVKFKEGMGPDAGFLKAHNVSSAKKISKADKAESRASKSFKKFGIDKMYLVNLSKESDLVKIMEDLNNNPGVEYAEPNYIYHTTAIPDDPSFDELWGMHNTGQTKGTADADIDAPEAWDIQTGSSDVVIAVIDTGVDYNHSDLSANIWTNLGEIPDNGVDDDGNGFIDDIHGYDFYNNDSDPIDDNDHGTHCAGTIGAVGNDGIGVAGVNWNVSIMPVKFLSSGGSGSTDGAINSVRYATLMGADIMSNSWGGGGYSQALGDAISAANDAGILFVAAAGNSGSNNDVSPHYPSNYEVPNVIAVAATDHDDDKASFSCYGATSVDLGAPGVDIYSTIIGDGYDTYSGTSMACPHVAGAAGLIKAQFPWLPAMGIKSMILDGVDPIPALNGITVTGGRLNAYNSLLSDIDSIAPDPVLDLGILDTTLTAVSLTWTASGDDGFGGTASYYDLRYSILPIDSENWDEATRARGEPAPQPSGTPENFTVENLEFSTTYHFALKVLDDFGNISGLSNLASGTTTIPVIAFEDDMESGVNGWTHSGAYDNWELGSPTSGPGYSHSGSNAWATNLNGNYGVDYMNAWLLSPSINLNEIESAQLMFQHYYYTEGFYDGGIVEISTDDGVFWTQIMPKGGYPEDALSSGNPLGSVPAYSGYSGDGWHKAVFDISSYDGYSNINIRFRFGTDYSVNGYPGWYIDDVAVFGQGSGENIPPIADAGVGQTVSDADGNGIETVTLDGSGSYDPDGNIVFYTWSEGIEFIGSGSTTDYDFSVGTHVVNLVVQDNEGATSSDGVIITVNPNQTPVANAGEDQSSLVGTMVNFDGSASYDPDGTIVSYEWDFDASDGFGVDATGTTTSHSYETVGDYTVTLTVTDNAGDSHADTLIVTVGLESMHITSIDMSATKIKLRGWYTYATAVVTIVDSNENFISGAEVLGVWSGLTNDFDSGVTDESGQVVFDSDSVKNANGIFTFTVTDVIEDGLVYNSGDNLETSDSITVGR